MVCTTQSKRTTLVFKAACAYVMADKETVSVASEPGSRMVVVTTSTKTAQVHDTGIKLARTAQLSVTRLAGWQ